MIYLSTYFEIAALITSAVALPSIENSKAMRLFPLLLLGIVIGELAGYYIYENKGNNALLYNLFITPFINVMYYCIVFFILKSAVLKKTIVVFAIIYIFFAIFTTLRWYNDENRYNILSHSVGSLFLIIILIRLFYEMMVNPVELDFLKKPSFYIFFALLLFHVASLAYFLMANWMGVHHKFVNVVYAVFDSLNYILYGTYIIAFIWIRMKGTY